MPVSIEKSEYFSRWGIADRILEFDVSSATVELAAIALNCERKDSKNIVIQTRRKMYLNCSCRRREN